MCVFLFFCLLLAGFSSAFRTNPFENPEDGSTLTHGRITRAGLWLSVIDFLIDNPDYVDENSVGEANLTSIDEVVRELKKGKVDDRLSSLVASPKFSEAVQEIEEANVLVESLEMSLAASHFYNEKLVDGSRRLLILKKRVIWLMQMKESNYEQARKEAGRYLHTLQDFYSNSNWVEFENVSPMEDLGDKIIGKSSVAGTEQETCRSCTPVDNLRDRSPVKDCYGNLIYWTEKLTSGYRYDKPGNASKCSHGGAYDDTRMIPSTGGINKESSSRSLSPHFYLHREAARLAIEATQHFFNSIRRQVNDTKFAEFLNLEFRETLQLSFVIDTTGSMSEEIEIVKATTYDIIDTFSREESSGTIYYVLAPFNDPDVGPVSSTTDPEVAKAKVRALKAVGGGDCPELSMQGLYQALIYSLPDSRIFLFTDADAKDAHLEPSVLSIAREKSCIIDPVLTGSCSRKRKKRSLPGGSLYERLATATGGQVLKYSKGDVKKVVELIKSEVNSTHSGSSAPSHKVTLLAIERKRSATKHPLSVQCDSSILSMIVVLSAASSPIIEVKPPEGHADRGVAHKDTTNIYRVHLTNPKPGNWTFLITATGPYSLKITGQATMAFKTSLFVEKHLGAHRTSVVPLSDNPVRGKKLYATVTPTIPDVLRSDEYITVYLIDVSGNQFGSFVLKPGKDLYSKLYFGKFVPDVRAFRLKLVGRSKTNETVERIVPSLIQPQTFELNLPEKGSFVIAPSALSVINVTLYNYGKTQNFEVLVSDDKSFVADYTPRVATVWSNTSIVIQVSLLAKAATPDGTSSSVSVSAKIRSKSGPKEDLVNFIVFHVAVYSKEFEFVNETALEADLASFLVAKTPKTPAPTPAPTPDLCAAVTCCCNATCEINGTNQAVCKCNFTCAHESEPVCGYDNKTYDSSCKLRLLACQRQDLNLMEANFGPCSQDNTFKPRLTTATPPRTKATTELLDTAARNLPLHGIVLITAGTSTLVVLTAIALYMVYKRLMVRKVGHISEKHYNVTVHDSGGELPRIAIS